MPDDSQPKHVPPEKSTGRKLITPDTTDDTHPLPNASIKIKKNLDNYIANMKEKIPSDYVPIVKKALFAAAGVAPLGIFGSFDAVGVGAVWTTMFFAIRKKSGSSLGTDPKRICMGAASGIARYYIGCKVATFTFFLVPGVGPFAVIAAAIGISGICNIYFTYNFAATLIELFEKKDFNDEEIIKFFIDHLKKLPNPEEIKEIIKIYQS